MRTKGCGQSSLLCAIPSMNIWQNSDAIRCRFVGADSQKSWFAKFTARQPGAGGDLYHVADFEVVQNPEVANGHPSGGLTFKADCHTEPAAACVRNDTL